MFQNYVTIALRQIARNKMFSAINILGLAVGFMSCILIMIFVQDEVGYDAWIPDSDRVARLHSAFEMPGRPPFLTVRSAGRLMEAIRDYAPAEVESAVRLVPVTMTMQKDGSGFAETLTLADGSFFDVFALPFVTGSAARSFTKPGDLILSEERAMRYFGRTDVVGETLTFCCLQEETLDFTVTGVIRDIPHNSHMNIDMLVYLDPPMLDPFPNMLNTWTSVNVYTYFKLQEGVTVAELQDRITYWVDNESPFQQMMAENGMDEGRPSDLIKQKVMALPDLHLYASRDAGNMGDMRPMGDIRMVYTFVLVAGMVLLIACINFVNLATARASQRAREVAMRKVLGASRTQIAVQFLGEAVAIAFLALIVAVAGVELTLPVYSGVLGRDFSFEFLLDGTMTLLILGLVLVVGLLSGTYPALYLSRFMPAKTLKANKSTSGGGQGVFRTALVVFQFAVSITLVVSTSVVYSQTLFARTLDTGFSSHNKLILNVERATTSRDALVTALEKIPGVTSVVLSSEAPTQDRENNTGFQLTTTLEGSGAAPQQVPLNYHTMGYGFFESYGVQPVAGRTFSRAYGTDMLVAPTEENPARTKAGAILNESAVRAFGFETPEAAVGQLVNGYRDGVDIEIIGVIPDLYFRSIKFGVRSTIYLLDPTQYRTATISFTADDTAMLVQSVEDAWNDHVPLQPVNHQFLGEMIHAQYQDEIAQGRLFAAFSLLAILVACLGLYGLASFTAERRTREIGIRKVMGAQVRDIIRLLVWQFSKPVMLANFLAWPVAWYLMNGWLQGFEYRIGQEFILLSLLGTGIVAVLIAWVTVAGRAYSVAQANPIHALRYE